MQILAVRDERLPGAALGAASASGSCRAGLILRAAAGMASEAAAGREVSVARARALDRGRPAEARASHSAARDAGGAPALRPGRTAWARAPRAERARCVALRVATGTRGPPGGSARAAHRRPLAARLADLPGAGAIAPRAKGRARGFGRAVGQRSRGAALGVAIGSRDLGTAPAQGAASGTAPEAAAGPEASGTRAGAFDRNRPAEARMGISSARGANGARTA